MDITDDMCRAAIQAYSPDRIQGFSTPQNPSRTEWGPPYYIRDVQQPYDRQEIWSGDDRDEMIERCKIERMRLALTAAFSANKRGAE